MAASICSRATASMLRADWTSTMISANRTADSGVVPMSRRAAARTAACASFIAAFGEPCPHRRHEHVAQLPAPAVGNFGEGHGKEVVCAHASGDVHPGAAGAAQPQRVPAVVGSRVKSFARRSTST